MAKLTTVGMLLLLIAILLLALTGCFNVETITDEDNQKANQDELIEPSPTIVPGTERDQNFFRYSEQDFSISYPEYWVLTDENEHYVNVVFQSPRMSEDEFVPSVNVYVFEDIERDQDFELDIYNDKVLVDLSQSFDEFTLMKRELILAGNIEGEAITYEAVLNAYTERRKLKSTQFIGENNGRIYIITYMSEKESYDTYWDMAEEIIKSITVS